MLKKSKRAICFIASFISLLIFSGCAAYVTPGAGVQLSTMGETKAEVDINELMAKEPAARFPANIAIVRVQAAGYRSQSNDSYGTGQYSIVTTRDVESEEDFERISHFPQVEGVAPINSILLPARLDSVKELRVAAARLKADILILYTFDTSFRVGAQKYMPLNVISLGFLKNKEVTVTTTATAAIFDVRTEFLYGIAESSVSESAFGRVWNSSDVVDDLRTATEQKAFKSLLTEMEKAWEGIVKTHGDT